MQAWIRNRAKTRKDGRMVFVTSVAFDAHLFEQLANAVPRERQRSAIVNEAIRHALATPGWVESTLTRLGGEEPERPREPPSSNSLIHARGGIDAPQTRRSPSSGRKRTPTGKG